MARGCVALGGCSMLLLMHQFLMNGGTPFVELFARIQRFTFVARFMLWMGI